MGNFERVQEESGQIDDPSRRNFLRTLGGLGAAVLCGGVPEVLAQDSNAPSRYGEKWFFSSEQIKTVYDHEYNGEKILKNCFRKEGERIIGMFNGKEIVVPSKFVDQILRHITEMIEAGAAQFVFRLDAFHGHAFMDEKLYRQRYGSELRDVVDETQILVTDPDVGILYHNSEHLDHKNTDPLVQDLVQRRNVIWRTRDTAIEILPLPQQGGNTMMKQSTPDDATDFRAFIKFAAHKDGVFAIKVGDKEIHLDLSLDDNSYF